MTEGRPASGRPSDNPQSQDQSTGHTCRDCGQRFVALIAFQMHKCESPQRHCHVCDEPVDREGFWDHVKACVKQKASNQDNHSDEQGAAKKRADELRGLLVDAAGLEKMPEPEPLIEGVLQTDSLTSMIGQPGHGKSFVALDMAAHIGNGLPWHGKAVQQGAVVYLVAEGVTGVKKRVRAWEMTHGSMSNVYFLPVAIQSTNATEWAAFIMAIRDLNPVLVVLDTQARITVGRDENSAKDMGEFVARLELLREHTGACVLAVHHQGRNGDHGRGSNSIDGAATTIVVVSKSGETVTLKNTKQKDLEEFPKLEFLLRQVELGHDAAFRPITSAVLEATGKEDDPTGDVVGHQERLVGLMAEYFRADGCTKAEMRAMAIEKHELPNSSFYKAWDALVAKGVFQAIDRTRRFRLVTVADRK